MIIQVRIYPHGRIVWIRRGGLDASEVVQGPENTDDI